MLPIMPNGVPLVFQFTPLREGRLCNFTRQCAVRHFNSRPCVRGDITHTLCFFQKFKFQFTPLREGRQKRPPAAAGVQANFNSRPCVRGDRASSCRAARRSLFQFTPLREGRLGEEITSDDNGVFQFTPLREGRPPLCDAPPVRLEFQFTPLREGRRQLCEDEGDLPFYFNSRPCVRGDASMPPKCATSA